MGDAVFLRRPLAVLLVLVCLAAACSSDGDDETSTADTTPETTGSGGEPVDSSAAEATSDQRGVTDDTITLAFTSVDFENLNSEFGLELTYQPFPPSIQPIVDDLNERGGVSGRQIAMIYREFLPVSSSDTADSICLELTEDQEVFLVLNGFAGQVEGVNECFGQNGHILIGGQPTEDQLDNAPVPWLTSNMSPSRRGPAFVELLIQTGTLPELGTVAVVASAPVDIDSATRVEEALVEAGTDVAFRTVLEGAGDPVATEAEVDVIIEKARTEGVDSVLIVGVYPALAITDMFETDPDLTYLLTDGESISGWTTDPIEELSPDTRVLTSREPPAADDPEVQRCVALVEEELGVEVIDDTMLGEGEPNYWAGMIGGCRLLAIFEQIATAAGDDLTTESFTAALGSVPDLVVPGWAYSSFGPEKLDARDSLALVEWDAENTEFDFLSEALDVG